MQVKRKVEYRLYPTTKQEQSLRETLRLHQRLYNAALQQRRMNYDLLGKSITFAKQCRGLTRLRAFRPEYQDLSAQSCQVTLKRVDLAFQGFFRRLKAGTHPAGFPRFKSLDRYHGWGYKTHGDGWKLLTNDTMTNGRLRLSGIGVVKLRGRARTPGLPKTCEIVHKAGRWYASITIECWPTRTCGTKAAGLDWGTETFLTIAEGNGTIQRIENPRYGRLRSKRLRSAQRHLTKKHGGSKNRNKARQRFAHLHRELANKRKNFIHQVTSSLVNGSGLLATESLGVKNMTAAGGRRKRGLNREILNTSPSAFLKILACKAEEAGS
jgi:putative transposase